MKDEIRKGFEKAIADAQSRDAAAERERQKDTSERQRFETEYRHKVETVIMPALQEITRDFLEPAGWQCELRRVELDLQVTLEVHRGDMKALPGGRERPHINFKCDRHLPRMNVYSATVYQAGPEGAHPLDAITADLVQKYALKFFETLTVHQ